MSKPLKVCEAHVEKRTWDPGDEYHVIQVQVDDLGLKAGDRVRVTIEALPVEGEITKE